MGPRPNQTATEEKSPAARLPAEAQSIERSPATADGRFALAKRYAGGDGVELDMVLAGHLAAAAARAGHTEAARWLEQIAAKSPFARLYLGVLLTNGPATLRNPVRGRENYESALSELRSLAERGDTNAIYALALAHQNGYGLKVDRREAVRWFERAAKAGHAKAATSLSDVYADGEDVPKNETLAAEYAHKAAEAGDVVGEFNYALMLANGRGVAQNEAAAFSYYRKAADGGMSGAQNNLALMFESGVAAAKDPAAARHWFERAAAQASPVGLYNLGRCYDTGIGGERDPQRARKLWQEAAELGWPAAKERLAVIAEREKCAAHGETKLFEVLVACADRAELRAAVERAGAKPVRVDDDFWYDRYASGGLLRGSTELSLGYTQSGLFAQAIYNLIANDETATRIGEMLTSKYGAPKRIRQIDGEALEYPRLTWKRKDGVEITLLRADTAMMLLYTHSAHEALLEQERKESDEAKRRREIERQSNAF